MSRQFNLLYNLISLCFLTVAFAALGATFSLAFVPDQVEGLPKKMLMLGAIGGLILMATLLYRSRTKALLADRDFWSEVRLLALSCLPMILFVFFLPTALKGGRPPFGEFVAVLVAGISCSFL